MRAVIQRVSRSSVSVEEKTIGQIEKGLMVLLGVEKDDGNTDADYIAEKIAHLRIFEDDAEKMNLSVKDVGGSILLISQFTLCADTKKGRRPGFDAAALPAQAESLYLYSADRLREMGLVVEMGCFGAHMAVELVNDGPVTLFLDSRKRI